MIDLSNRGLTECPSFVWKLASARVIKLDHNRLTQVVIPSGAIALNDVEEIDLSNNLLEEVPEIFATCRAAEKRLRRLDVSSNRLCALPPAYHVLFYVEPDGSNHYHRYGFHYNTLTKNRVLFHNNPMLEKKLKEAFDMDDSTETLSMRPGRLQEQLQQLMDEQEQTREEMKMRAMPDVHVPEGRVMAEANLKHVEERKQDKHEKQREREREKKLNDKAIARERQATLEERL